MELDQLAIQRFDELQKKAELVAQSNRSSNRNTLQKTSYVSSQAFEEWATNVMNLLKRLFGEDSVHYQNFVAKYKFGPMFQNFEACRGIFSAAKEDYEGGYLFNAKSLIKAEVLEDVIEQADVLLKAGYKDPACVVIGVTLETTLKEICGRKGIPLDKMDRMNVELCKAGIYNLSKQKQITAWADLRNKAAHGDWNAYNEADVIDFIQGVRRFIADYL